MWLVFGNRVACSGGLVRIADTWYGAKVHVVLLWLVWFSRGSDGGLLSAVGFRRRETDTESVRDLYAGKSGTAVSLLGAQFVHVVVLCQLIVCLLVSFSTSVIFVIFELKISSWIYKTIYCLLFLDVNLSQVRFVREFGLLYEFDLRVRFEFRRSFIVLLKYSLLQVQEVVFFSLQ